MVVKSHGGTDALGFAHAMDLALDIALVGERDIDTVEAVSDELDAHVVPITAFDIVKPQLAADRRAAANTIDPRD